MFLEEASVREAAFASMKTVSESLPQNTFRDQYDNALLRLAKSEWFTARMSSAGLICAAYPRFTPEQQKVHLSLFIGLCQDDTPMARRVAAQNLGEMVRNVVESNGRETLEADGIVTTSLIPLYEELASNDQPVSGTSTGLSLVAQKVHILINLVCRILFVFKRHTIA